MKHLVIGLGEIGCPLRDILSLGPDEVCGRDLDANGVTGRFDCVHICYPFSPSFVDDTLAYLEEYEPEIVFIHSTVVPGTTAQVDAAYQEVAPDSIVAYSPVRGRHRFMHRDLLSYTKFVAVAGHNDNALGFLAQDVLEDALKRGGFAVALMVPVEALELAKLLETTYSGLLITWAQEMARFCGEVDAEYLNVAAFFAEIDYLPSVAFQPGFVGGHCIMPNLTLLEAVRPSPFAEVIRESNAERGARADFDPDERLRPVPMDVVLRRLKCAC